MAVSDNKFDPDVGQEEELIFDKASDFEAYMLEKIKGDYERAQQHRDAERALVYKHEQQYRNAERYKELVGAKEFPAPVAQHLVDQFRNQLMDKLFFAGQPCRITGVEEGDVKDAEAKSRMMEWQDERDGIFDKIGQAVVDCAVRRFCVAVVDYTETTKPIWRPQKEDEIAEGEEPKYIKIDETDYLGAVVKMIDPQDFFYGPDKRETNDSFPLMIRSFRARDYFNSEKYFYNLEQLDEMKGGATGPSSDPFKQAMGATATTTSDSQQDNEYVEWQGYVQQGALRRYLKSRNRPVSEMTPKDEKEKANELIWTTSGMVNGDVLVRCEEHFLGETNVVVGAIEHAGSPYRPRSIMDKIYPICRAADKALGQLTVNIEQNIDAMWIINSKKLEGKGPIVNRRGAILLCVDDVDKVARRIEQLPLTEPLMSLLVRYDQMARDAAGLPSIVLGEGDADAETLGENTLAEGHGRLGVGNYLKTFESTFIKPLWQCRNRVNEELIDKKFRYRVLGEKADDWREITPEQVRASVDFICESSTRESNRAVTIQQSLNLLKLAPEVQAMGFPVRSDKLLARIAESGMTFSQEFIEDLLPTIKFEKQLEGVDIDEMLAQAAFMQFGIAADQLAASLPSVAGGPPEGGGGGGGPDITGPTTEGDALQGALKEQSTDLREVG